MEIMIYFIVFLAASLPDQTLGYDVSLSKNYAVSGESLDIHLNIGTISSLVDLYRPDGTSVGTCSAPLGGSIGTCAPGLSQANGITTYSIATVSRASDQGVWTSLHGSETGSINITVYTIPTVTESNSVLSMTLSSDSSNTQNLTITVTCAYPAVSLDLSFVPTGGGNEVNAPSSTSTCTSTGNTGCSDTDANSYTCDITPQYEATLSAGTTYHIKAAVKLDGLSIGVDITINGTDITVQGTPSPTVSPKCSCSWLPSGWKCYYMYIIIVVVVVLLVVVTVSVCCCCRHGYCAFCACSACCRRKDNEDKYHVGDMNLN